MGSRASPDLYEVLGVDKTASGSAITRAYRKRAREVHPDKVGGDAEKFKELNHAHEVLSDAEKRAVYDEHGEEGLQNGAPPKSDDLFSSFFSGAATKPAKRRTKDVVHVLPVTLEQLYAGKTKMMAVRREVVDKASAVNTCSDCNGRGSKVQVQHLGGMSHQVSAPCRSCQGTGKIFKHTQNKEVLKVHIQKGAPDGHKIVFREKADELPGAETGDVVFVVKEQEHAEFKRKGADLYIERTISLSEALCGFELEVTHLDGRRLLIKSAPGDVVRPMPRGFDPLKCDDGAQTWECVEGVDCPSIETVAEASLTDVDKLKHACKTQLKRQGVDVCAFVVDHDSGRAQFKSGKRQDVIAAQQKNKSCTMYVVTDTDSENKSRMMKAVKDEGMPTLKNPFVYGNLFIILNIEFPQSLSSDAQEGLKALLPPLLNTPMLGTDDDIEVHTLVDIDPVQSCSLNQANMAVNGEAYDEDEAHARPEQPQCAQM